MFSLSLPLMNPPPHVVCGFLNTLADFECVCVSSSAPHKHLHVHNLDNVSMNYLWCLHLIALNGWIQQLTLSGKSQKRLEITQKSRACTTCAKGYSSGLCLIPTCSTLLPVVPSLFPLLPVILQLHYQIKAKSSHKNNLKKRAYQ